jgi:uncharacterized OB-fold protein
MQEEPRPYPQPDRDSAPFWEAQRRHELLFRRCIDCGAFRYPMTLLCLNCRSFDFEWAASAGRGIVFSYTVVHHQTHPAFSVPYTMLLVEMEEGPRVVSQLRAPNGTAVSIGMPVHVEWEDHPDQSLPVFVPGRL